MYLQKFNIKGMTCSACQASIESNIKKIKGVFEVNVSLLRNNMTVKYDSNLLNNETIINKVSSLGYEAYLNSDSNKSLQKDFKKQNLIFSFIFLIPLVYISMGHMFNLPFLDLFNEFNNILYFSILQFFLVMPIIFINRNYYIAGFKSLFKFSPNMDSLIAIGTSASTSYGIYILIKIINCYILNDINNAISFSHDLYFETTGVILSLISFGKYLESKAKNYTSKTIESLIKLSPKKAIVEKSNKEYEINIDNLELSDIVVVKQGFVIPADGIIVFGNCLIDESMITGESMLIDKAINDSVIAGSICKSGYIKFKVIKTKNDTVLSQIIKLVEEAGASKIPISKLVDKISSIFVPFIIFVSIISFLIWIFLGYSFEFSLSIAISVLIISCPCALGLATPISIMIAIGKAFENGILIQNAQALENLYKIDTIVFDKTGTITTGKIKVSDILVKDKINKNELLQYCASIEKKSEHILSNGIIQKAIEENLEFLDIESFNIINGQGIETKINNELFYLGNKKLLENKNISISEFEIESEKLLNNGKIVVFFANSHEVLGLISLLDYLKPTSKKTIFELKNMNLDVFMLTGDNKSTSNAIAKQVGINNVYYEIMPQDKYKKIQELQKLGKNVAMVGDGINDTPALAISNVSFALSSGSNIAIQTANIVLARNDLMDIITAIKLSKKTMQNIKQNLFFAFFYNIIGIPLAAGAFYMLFSWKLNPMFAAIAMSFSSLAVVLNALRLKLFKNVKYDEVGFNNKDKLELNLIVNKMKCDNCKQKVINCLKELDYIIEVDVNLSTKNVKIIMTKQIDKKILIEAIENCGYEVIS